MRGAFIYLVVAVFQLYAAHGFERVLDLHIYDECMYLRNGRAIFEGTTDWQLLLAWSGPYQMLYGLLDLAGLGTRVQDVMCILLALASSLALLWALAGLVSLEAAAAMTILWASGSAYPGGMNGVYLCGAIFVFLGAGSLVRGREASGGALLFLAALTRPELLLWTGSAGLVAALLGRRRAGLFLALGAATLLVLQLRLDENDRSGLAFRQHYAQGAAARRLEAAGLIGSAEDTPQYAFEHPERWVRESFGDATSLAGALAANPQEVGRHVLGNLGELAGLFRPLAGGFPAAIPMQICMAVVLGLLAALGFADLLGAVRRGRAFDSPPSTWMAALVLTTPMLAATSILFGPRLCYVITAFLPLIFLAQRGARRLYDLRARVHGLRPSAWAGERVGLARGDLGLLALAALLLAAVSAPRPSDSLTEWALKWRRIIAAAEREGGGCAVLGNPRLANVLLPPGNQLFGVSGGLPDDVTRLLLHASDLSEYRLGGVAHDEEEQLRRILEDGGWRPLRYSDEVLLVVREGT